MIHNLAHRRDNSRSTTPVSYTHLFGYQLPYQDAMVDLLQVVIVSDNTLSVKEAALQLICDYAWPPFPVLEELSLIHI